MGRDDNARPRAYGELVRIESGRIVHGQIVLDTSENLTEGARVTVLVQDAEQGFDLGERETAELLAAIEEANRGELVEADEVLAELRAS